MAAAASAAMLDGALLHPQRWQEPRRRAELCAALAGGGHEALRGLVLRLEAPAVGSFRAEAATQLLGALVVELATHERCGPRQLLEAMAGTSDAPRLWDALCEAMIAAAADERLGDGQRAAVFGRILRGVNALPHRMPAQLARRARLGAAALQALLDAAPGDARFLLLSGGGGEGDDGGGWAERGAHWLLAPAVLRCARRRRRLRTLLRPLGPPSPLLDSGRPSPRPDPYLALAPQGAAEATKAAVATLTELLRQDVEQSWLCAALRSGRLDGGRPQPPGTPHPDGSFPALEEALAGHIEAALRACDGELAEDVVGGGGFERWLHLADLCSGCQRDGLVRAPILLSPKPDPLRTCHPGVS